MFIPKYNARFALPIDNNKNHFICLDEDFDYNIELAIWSEHKVYHNSYLKYDNSYHVILDDDKKSYIPTSGNVKVYTFLDGSNHVLFDEKFYDVKSIKDFHQELKQSFTLTKTQEQINLSKSHKPTNSPWAKGLPPLPSHKTSQWAYLNGC